MTRGIYRSTSAVFRCAAICAVTALLSTADARASMASDRVPAEMLRYKLTCLLEEDHARIRCSAAIWIRVLRDSLASVTFRIPSASKIISVTDENDRTIGFLINPSVNNPEMSLLECPLPDTVAVNDSLLFRIRYSVVEDTASTGARFINAREFLLQSDRSGTYVPILIPSVHDPMRSHPALEIELHASPSYAIISGGSVDSVGVQENRTVWRIVRTDVVHEWDEAFCIAGSTDTRTVVAPGRPGMCGVTLFAPLNGFDSSFARSIVHKLFEASAYFASQRCIPRFDRMTFASIGRASIDSEPIVSGSLVLVRTGPEHAQFDSSAFIFSAHNVWLLETSRAYAFRVPDSSYWFDESWAGYLATRFLFSAPGSDPARQIRERSHLLSHALDFYPEQPLADGATGERGRKDVFTYKGRYVFLMLDYILGRESFDAVIRSLYGEAAAGQPPTISHLQALCEQIYGSPLDWFFEEWLYKTGFPEYVLTSTTTPTLRGSFEVTVTVTQRGEMFVMPINVYFETAAKSFLKRIFVSQPEQRFTFTLPSAPLRVEWNPQYLVLRWIPTFRILAHARTSISYRVYSRDLPSSEKEAHLTLQLDPANSIGANAIALFSLGKAAGARHEWSRADSLFLEASHQHAGGEYAFYPLLSAVRRANILDLTGRREEAQELYSKTLETAGRDPLTYGRVIVEARRYLSQPFVQTDDVWFDKY
ncbi:MAG TPA: hypothetical protein VK470_16480 [Bacteroidota bacterium]|nr:hypothetical protein [Bacteroidota bacterium]